MRRLFAVLVGILITSAFAVGQDDSSTGQSLAQARQALSDCDASIRQTLLTVTRKARVLRLASEAAASLDGGGASQVRAREGISAAVQLAQEGSDLGAPTNNTLNAMARLLGSSSAPGTSTTLRAQLFAELVPLEREVIQETVALDQDLKTLTSLERAIALLSVDVRTAIAVGIGNCAHAQELAVR